MILTTAIDARDAGFRANAAAMAELVADLRAQVARAALGGGAQARQRHRSAASCCRASESTRCSIPVRRSWNFPNSPRYGMYGNEVPCAGLIAGIGRVAGANAWWCATTRR